jgi:hypothetical protein
MKLPSGDRAVVDLQKLVDYCLDPEHPRGKHKARVFRSACGIGPEHADLLRQQLLLAAESDEAAPARFDTHGRRYVIEFNVSGPAGEALVRSAWIVRTDEDFPRFVNAYVM